MKDKNKLEDSSYQMSRFTVKLHYSRQYKNDIRIDESMEQKQRI